MDRKSIPAIAKGTIKLRCGKGHYITLRDMLLVPAAVLCLISICKLADDGLITTVRDTTCHVQNKAGKPIADRLRKSKGLYYLAGADLQIKEHALLSCASPDLATWH